MNIIDFYPGYREIGYTKKTFGVNGKLKIHIDPGYQNSFIAAKHCFLFLDGSLVPYFIVNGKEEKEDGVVEFDWVNTPEEARRVVSKKVFLHNDQMKEEKAVESELLFGFLLNFSVYDDETEEFIGLITNIEAFPEQEIATVTVNDEKTFMTPLNTINIKAIDEEGRNVWLEIPEGLIEL